MSRKVAIYARVSTRHQEFENQLAELSAASQLAGREGIY